VLDRGISEVFSRWEAVAAEIPVSAGSDAARPVTLPLEVEGRELWLSFVAVRIERGIVYTFRDLTFDRGLDAAKSDFIATVSHELRTPMTAVLGAAKTLLRDDIELSPERRQQLLEMIGAQGLRLTQITEEVLLANRLDRGDLRIDSERVDLETVVRDAVETMRERLPESISVRAEGNGDAAAVGDRDRIEQVLVNLLDNAVKYSPDGGEVVVSTVPSSATVRVEVADEGMGIPASEQEAVFEKFYRGDPQHRAVPSGTGLGLYVCRELVRRMGGTIGVRSEPGRGSTFWFDLPRA
jgi:signal transduction histidine kinase